MKSDNYRQALEQTQANLISAIRERDRLNLEIIRLQRLASSLAVMCSQSEKEEAAWQSIYAEISFIDTVHAIIRSAGRPLTAPEVRDSLRSYGYDLSVYANPLVFVHTALRRLTKDGRIRQIRPGVYAPNQFWEALLRVQP
jgi:hypothetical protein